MAAPTTCPGGSVHGEILPQQRGERTALGGAPLTRARSANAPPRPAQQTAPRSASPAAGTPGKRALTLETGGGL